MVVKKKKPGRPKLKAKERHTERETVSFTKSEMKSLRRQHKAWLNVTPIPTLEAYGKEPIPFAVFLRLVLTGVTPAFKTSFPY